MSPEVVPGTARGAANDVMARYEQMSNVTIFEEYMLVNKVDERRRTRVVSASTTTRIECLMLGLNSKCQVGGLLGYIQE